MEELPPYTAPPCYEEETLLPELPVEIWERSISLIPVVYVYNVWRPECGHGDGTGECMFSSKDYDGWTRENEALLNYSRLEEYVTLTTGQFLLVTARYNLHYSCCSGYYYITLEVFDHEPDLSDYPDQDNYGSDGLEYQIYSHAKALGMV